MLGNAIIQHVPQETALTFPSDGPWKLDAARDVFTVSGVLPLVVGQWGHTCCPRGGVEVTGAEG